jgi:hypothetical protein
LKDELKVSHSLISNFDLHDTTHVKESNSRYESMEFVQVNITHSFNQYLLLEHKLNEFFVFDATQVC